MQGKSLLARMFLKMIRLYQRWLSPMIGHWCRFSPTCSRYGAEAIARHGACKGGWLTIRRLARCTPWGGQGFDPVPKE
ncbi:MAG: membrane protein insertion efficiency factor YidD [Planctomycetota bacterium]|nr:membrane protein insertion efficiency factor YidD [Planctomycetota bacterium]